MPIIELPIIEVRSLVGLPEIYPAIARITKIFVAATGIGCGLYVLPISEKRRWY